MYVTTKQGLLLFFDITKPDGTPKKLLDSSKINQLGWRPKIKLIDGVKEVINDVQYQLI